MCNVERLKSRNLTPNAACVHSCEFESGKIRDNVSVDRTSEGTQTHATWLPSCSGETWPSLPGASLGKSLSLKSGYEDRVQIQIQKQIPPVPCLLGPSLGGVGRYDLLDVTISLIKYKKAALAPNNAGRHISNSLQTWKCGTFHIIGGM